MAETASGPARPIFSSFNNRTAEFSWAHVFPARRYISHIPLQDVVMQQSSGLLDVTRENVWQFCVAPLKGMKGTVLDMLLIAMGCSVDVVEGGRVFLLDLEMETPGRGWQSCAPSPSLPAPRP